MTGIYIYIIYQFGKEHNMACFLIPTDSTCRCFFVGLVQSTRFSFGNEPCVVFSIAISMTNCSFTPTISVCVVLL